MEKKLRDLKHIYVYDENDNIVNALQMTEQDRVDHRFYIPGIREDTLTEGRERVILVLCKNRRNHFRRYNEDTISTEDLEIIQRVKEVDSYKETLIHRLAKKLLVQGEITEIVLPRTKIDIPNFGVFESNKLETYSIKDCTSEIRKVVPDTDDKEYVVFDALATNGYRQIAIEILVNHKCDEEKIKKVKQIGIDTIEIDLSELLNTKDIETGTLERAIIKKIKSEAPRVWIYNRRVYELRQALSKVVVIDEHIHQSRIPSDGDWFFWKDRWERKLTKCGHMILWNKSSPKSCDRWITEAQCIHCFRYMGSYKDEKGNYRVLCNQSTCFTGSMLGALLKLGIMEVSNK